MTRQTYGSVSLAADIRRALESVYSAYHLFSIEDLAGFDQFHTRGLAATADLAKTAEVARGMRVLDVGCGLGGPARFLAATYGCSVIGVDASPSFVETARMLTERSAVANAVAFEHADALELPFADGSFDLVWMQHVAMNIADRPALYRELHRVLAPDGRFATYDVVRGSGEIAYPVPWAEDPSVSFLLSESETRSALESAGFDVRIWQVETEIARAWFAGAPLSVPAAPINLGMAMGPAFRDAVGNFGRNVASGALGIVVAVGSRR